MLEEVEKETESYYSDDEEDYDSESSASLADSEIYNVLVDEMEST